LAAEDYACGFCALVYPEITIDDAVLVIVGLPGMVGAVVSATPPEACRIRAEDRPALEPMFNDLLRASASKSLIRAKGTVNGISG
jgi:hypothetical protein